MDRKFSNNTKLDDTDVFSAIIERSIATQGHTEYVIRVQRGPLAENCWRAKKRYNDFVELQSALHIISNVELALPPKKIFGNMEREFISQRQQGLQSYLNLLLANPMWATSLAVKRFLDPVNYFYNFQEKSYQQVLMMFRSDPTWNVVEAVGDIGWRIRKQYYLVRQIQDPLQDFLLSRCNYGPDFCLNEKESSGILRHLCSISHPLIFSPSMACVDNSGGVAVYSYQPEGSLRDYIYKSQPRTVYLKKYKATKSVSSVSTIEIKSYGRQILEALQDLHSKGIPYGHLNAGNVFIRDGVCRISSLENIFLGLSPFYRPFATQLKKVKTLVELDVYAFGHIMYEMTFGCSLTAPTCDTYPSTCPPEIKSVLESILTTEACKGGLPTVEHLLTHPLFGDVTSIVKGSKSLIKMTAQMQEVCKSVRTKVEQRLLEDQKLMRKVQRLQRAQSVLLEENRFGFARNSQVKKLKENGSNDGHFISQTKSPGNSSNLDSSTPTLLESSDTEKRHLGDKKEDINFAPLPLLHPVENVAEPNDRSALLNSIQGFNTNKLKKAITNDRSKPQT